MKLPEQVKFEIQIFLFVIIIELFVEKYLINKQWIHQEQNDWKMVLLITSPICQTKDYQDYKNVAK